MRSTAEIFDEGTAEFDEAPLDTSGSEFHEATAEFDKAQPEILG